METVRPWVHLALEWRNFISCPIIQNQVCCGYSNANDPPCLRLLTQAGPNAHVGPVITDSSWNSGAEKPGAGRWAAWCPHPGQGYALWKSSRSDRTSLKRMPSCLASCPASSFGPCSPTASLSISSSITLGSTELYSRCILPKRHRVPLPQSACPFV